MQKIIKTILIASLLLTASCSTPNNIENSQKKLTIITTFPHLYSFTKNITKDKCNVINLVPANVSLHTWQPKPSDMQKIARADLLIKNGLQLEVFLDNLIKTNDNPNLQILDTGKNLTNYTLEDDEHGTNPHISLSPKLAIKQTENIKNKLQQLDPQNSEFYENNFKAYQKKLENLSKNIENQFKNTEKKDFLVFHEAYNYYLQEFNLLNYQKGSIEEFPGKEPSPAYLQSLIKEVQQQNIKIIFTEPQFSPKIVQTLKEELNIKNFELDPIGQELTSDGYENNIQQVTNTIIKAFKN